MVRFQMRKQAYSLPSDEQAAISACGGANMTKDIAARYRIKPGAGVQLATLDAGDIAGFPDKKAAKKQIKKDAKIINTLQDRLYAERTRALLVVLQGIDTSGKDGTIRKVFNRTGPLGV